ncbi:MAG: hypothetical protein WBM86_09940 [Waterburya sp.]
MTKDSKKYPVELDNYECSLILNNAVIFGQLKTTLTRMSKKEGIHTIEMTLDDINEIAGWMAAESNHARSQRKSEELGDLCDHLENIIYLAKRNML